MNSNNRNSRTAHSGLSCSNISDSNIKELLEDIPFHFIEKKEDYERTFIRYFREALPLHSQKSELARGTTTTPIIYS
jgi:hypothetical protein